MPIPRRAKRDSNEGEIIRALRAAGCSIVSINIPGAADLMVGCRGINLLLETKGKRGKLTEEQERFIENWQGQYAVVRTVEEALAVIEKYTT